ncbi:MAG: nucleotidyltransferase [Acidobacteriia bacterium]|nr:nucleotidyltransferase [Terriglobia bacterium]
MRLSKDLREFIESLNSHAVEYVIVGAYALAYHGSPRYTGDVDILIRPSAENADRLEGAIRKFGFGSLGLGADDFREPYQVIQLGHPPNRIDLLTGLTGVLFDEAWEGREPGDLDGIPVQFIGREAFLKNKRATGRLKDRADLEALGEQ